MLLMVVLALLFASPRARAEQACIMYHTCISIDAFKCDAITRSTAIARVCYLEEKRYLVFWFKQRGGSASNPYHHCELGPDVYREFMDAPSMGRFYNQRIGGTRNRHGPFDCQDHPIPSL
jgi:hypothetical protein